VTYVAILAVRTQGAERAIAAFHEARQSSGGLGEARQGSPSGLKYFVVNYVSSPVVRQREPTPSPVAVNVPRSALRGREE